jgi:hypothetical protein
MADIRIAPLRAWSLATFHTVTFVVAAAAFEHASDSLKEALARLDTKTGVAASTSSIVFGTTIAGAWNGVGVFAILVSVGLVSGFATRGFEAMRLLPVQFLTAALGSLPAFTVGAVAGLVYGLVDALLIGCAEMLYRASNASTSA